MATFPARWPWRRPTVPASLIPLLGPDERLLTAAACVDGTVLAASRFCLWVVGDAGPERFGWHLVSKARLTARVLTITAAAVIVSTRAVSRALDTRCQPNRSGPASPTTQRQKRLAAKTVPSTHAAAVSSRSSGPSRGISDAGTVGRRQGQRAGNVAITPHWPVRPVRVGAGRPR